MTLGPAFWDCKESVAGVAIPVGQQGGQRLRVWNKPGTLGRDQGEQRMARSG